MASIVERLPYSVAVWWRHFLVWQKTVWSSLAMQMVNPVLYLFAFGFGLGAIVGEMGGMDYLTFIVPGMMAYSMMFTASFEATISAYSRLTMQQTWSAILATPRNPPGTHARRERLGDRQGPFLLYRRHHRRLALGRYRVPSRCADQHDCPGDGRLHLLRLRPCRDRACEELGIHQLFHDLLGHPKPSSSQASFSRSIVSRHSSRR